MLAGLHAVTQINFLWVSYDQHESPTIPHPHPISILKLTDKLPLSCNILIADDGIIDQSVAYHLSELNVQNIVHIEKAKVKIIEVCYVEEILIEKQRTRQSNRIAGAVISKGHIKCNVFTDCTGTWTQELGFQVSPTVRIPTQASNFPINIPTVHNPEERSYSQLLADHSVLIGGFLRQSISIFSNSVSDAFDLSRLSNNWDDFPESECEMLITGADVFISDDGLIMNESAEIDSYFVASGSNGHDIVLTDGVGKYITELMHNGNTNLNRLREIPGKQNSLKYPTYAEVLGYERPLFFKSDEVGKKGFKDISKQYTFGKARWFNTVKKEYNACRKCVATTGGVSR
ncbi:unnamed protein product [Adineta steineri]|uniref:Uncharacterized protein n=1 Tax=Adineta steineri TaxID=433720 RepID=A0A814YPK9_9BILA|nr:unnamed protein product [Adineta steineri]